MGAVGRVEVDEDGADAGGGVLDEHPLRAVGAPDADAVTLLDAGREEAAGQVVDRGVELRVRQAHVLEGDDERLVVGEAGDRRREVLADRLADEGHRGRAVRVGLDHLGHRSHPLGCAPATVRVAAVLCRGGHIRASPRPERPRAGSHQGPSGRERKVLVSELDLPTIAEAVTDRHEALALLDRHRANTWLVRNEFGYVVTRYEDCVGHPAGPSILLRRRAWSRSSRA